MPLLNNSKVFIKEVDGGVIINLLIQPKASKNEIIGIHGEALKVKLTSPPVDGKANLQCIKFLSSFFGVSKSSIEILSGEKGRSKRIMVFGLDKQMVLENLRSKGYV